MKKGMLFTILLCFFINYCSRLDLATQFASSYVVNKADDYFDLTSDQKKWTKEKFNKDFNQVQKMIFPQIAMEFMKAADVVESKHPIDPATVMISYERLKNLFYEGLRLFSADTVLFVDQLTPKQVANFQKEFDKKMRDLKEDESSKEVYKKAKKHFESWVGSMTSAQKKELEKFCIDNPPLTSEKIYNRQLLAHEFVNAYPDKENRKHFIEKLTTHFDIVYEEKFSKLSRDRSNKFAWMVTSFLNKMSDDQRETLVETLRDRANQLLKISRN